MHITARSALSIALLSGLLLSATASAKPGFVARAIERHHAYTDARRALAKAGQEDKDVAIYHAGLRSQKGKHGTVALATAVHGAMSAALPLYGVIGVPLIALGGAAMHDGHNEALAPALDKAAESKRLSQAVRLQVEAARSRLFVVRPH